MNDALCVKVFQCSCDLEENPQIAVDVGFELFVEVRELSPCELLDDDAADFSLAAACSRTPSAASK